MSTPVIYPDAEALAVSVATTLLVRLHDAQARGEEPAVCLTGGTIAREIHREVARRTPDSGVDWRRVHLWWGDERFVARDSDERNARQAREDLLDHVDVDPAKVHEAPAADDCADVDEAARRYDAELAAAVGDFEVVMLGVGPDGHVASLFPGRPQLADEDHDVVGVPDSPKPPSERVSLTFRALDRSRAVWLVVSGEGKAEAVARAHAEDTTVDEIPAIGVAGADETVWHLDQAAASRL